MLSGIKTGKRKRPAPEASATPASASAAASASIDEENRSAADALRASLLGGVDCVGADGAATKIDLVDNVQARLDARASSYKNNESIIQSFESRGRISQETLAADDQHNVVINTKIPSSKDIHQHEKEFGVRYNSRGTLSRHAHATLRQKTEEEMTIEQMVAHERKNKSMDEIYARNILKRKDFKQLDKIMGTNSKSGADEEDYGQETSQFVSSLYQSNDDKYAPSTLAMKQKSQQIAQHDALARWTSKSWWWIESPTFNKQYLIALGDKCSLVMCPTHLALDQESKSSSSSFWTGGQCFIVPLPYCESFVGLDEEVWQEVYRFQKSLRKMFKREGREVLFLETVTRTSRGGGVGGGGDGLALQAKMIAIPVPRRVERDAPLFFKSALAEVAQEWGVHGQKPIILNDKKTLRNSVPRGFPYFYCGWEGGGYVQLIENEEDDDDGDGYDGSAGLKASGVSKRFSRDFGIDTIAGMMELDPVRFHRRQWSAEGDRRAIAKFCEKWKPFDWTLELDV